MPTLKTWSTQYPTNLDSVTQMPSLTANEDLTHPTQIQALRDAVIQLQTIVGSDNLESGSIRANTGGEVGSYVSPPTVPHANDDEFTDGTLDLVKWTRNYTVSATAINVTDTFNTGDPREDLNNIRPSWLYVQPVGINALNVVSQAVSLPTDTFMYTRIKSSHSIPGHNNTGDSGIGIALFEDSGGSIVSGESIRFRYRTTAFHTYKLIVESLSGGVATLVGESNDLYNDGMTLFDFLGIAKRGNEYHFFAWSASGGSLYLGLTNRSWTPGHVGLMCNGFQGTSRPAPVLGWDFYRQVDGTGFVV